MIHREHRHFTRSICTETLQSVTKSIHESESEEDKPVKRKSVFSEKGKK